MNQQDQIYIDSVQEQIKSGMYDHLFEIRVAKLACNPSRRNMVFLDIGANIGLVSVYATPYCKRIIAVEPAPNIREELQERTKPFPVIERHYVALADHDGQTRFYINDINFTASSTANTYGAPTTVHCRKLSSILNHFELTHVDVCKIDVEGEEGEALNLSELESASGIIKTYYIETHNCPKTTWEHKLGTIVGNLARCGYSKMTIDGMAITATRS